MNSSILLSADASAAAGGSMWISLAMIVVLVGVMYFVMIRPQNKRRKKEEKMRQDLQIGDEVTTIGGIMAVSYTHLDVYKRQPQRLYFATWALCWQ